MKFKIISFVLTLFLFSTLLFAEFNESRILERGGIKSSAIANANSGKTRETELFGESPASSADLAYPCLSLSYGDIRGYNTFFDLYYSHPSSIDVISGNIKFFNAKDKDEKLDKIFLVNLNISLIFTEKLFTGIGFRFLAARHIDENKVSVGLNLGAIYHFYNFNENRKNKIIDNIKFGLSCLNIGNPLIYKDPDTNIKTIISPPYKIKTGPSVVFNVSKYIKNETTLDMELREFKDSEINIGFDTIFYDKLTIRAGYSIDSNYQDFSFGFGYKFKVAKMILEANYSCVSSKIKETLHYLGMEIHFDSISTSTITNISKTDIKKVYLNVYDSEFEYIHPKAPEDIEEPKKIEKIEKIVKTDKTSVTKDTKEIKKIKEAIKTKKISVTKDTKDTKEVSKPKSYILNVKMKLSPLSFSPDGDDKNDLLYINILNANDEIKSWKLKIYSVNGESPGSIIMQYKGNKLSRKPLIWNGKNKNGELVESGVKYKFVLTVTDILNNTKTVKKFFTIPLLIKRTSDGLRPILRNIEFRYKKADLTDKTLITLNCIIDLLKKYSDYKIIIEGHTDSVGSKKYNLELSRNRAKAVYDYLIGKGITKTRITIQGLWFSRPVAPNRNPDGTDNREGRAKNRRFELLLVPE